MKRKPSKKALVTAGVLLIAASLGIGYFFTVKEPVTVEAVRIAPVEEIIKERGILRSDTRVDLFSPVTGELQQVGIGIGDRVAEGELLMVMDDTQARLRLDGLSYEVMALESTLELNGATGDGEAVGIAREDYLRAKKDYENAVVLYESGALSRGERDSIALLFRVAAMQLEAAKEMSSAEHFKLKSLQTQVEILKEELSSYQIRAPFEGVVSEIHVKRGQQIFPGTALVEIYEEAYYIEVDLLEEELLRLSTKTPVRILVEGTCVESAIRKIHPTIKPAMSDMGVTQLKGLVEIEACREKSLPGREYDVEFVLKAEPRALTVDKQALVKFDGGDYVYEVLGGKAVLTQVTLGIEGRDRYEILSGLEEGDLVILNPSQALRDGTKVAIAG
ncbi:MAG: hypothetical protein AVO33_07225 [delta proteobacterium ML8_F1]|nr:MAG: hypothetical protein AVO33_07225 [delta proteobacterium ML8_F1]